MDQHVGCNLRGTLQFHGLYFQKLHQVLMVKIQVGSPCGSDWGRSVVLVKHTEPSSEHKCHSSRSP